jgi:hypothetical protein
VLPARDKTSPLAPDPLRPVSARIGSPFKLDVNITFSGFKEAADAFTSLLRGVATLPSQVSIANQHAEQEKLKTREMRAVTQTAEKVERNFRDQIGHWHAADAIVSNALGSPLNVAEITDREAKLRPISRDVQRVLESPLRVTEVSEIQSGGDRSDKTDESTESQLEGLNS